MQMIDRQTINRPSPRAAARSLALLVFVASLVLSGIGAAFAQDASPVASPTASSDLYSAITDSERVEVEQETAGKLSTYRIIAGVDLEQHQVAGTVELTYLNQTGAPISELPLRLYPNDAVYQSADMTLGNVRVADKYAPFTLDDDDTLAEIPFAEPLAAGATIEIIIPFISTLPPSSEGYGMYGYTDSTGTWTMAGWYPSVAGWDPVDGWNLDPLSKNGDPIFTNVSLYDVTLTTPTSLAVVATGEETATTTVGASNTEHRFVSGPVRDFMIVLDDNFQAISTQVGETTIRSWYNADTPDGADIAMQTAVQSFSLYSQRYGAYPYADLDVVQTPIGGGAGGVEFPGLVLIGSDAYDKQVHGDDGNASDILEFTVAHEVAHQWWYGLVGNNQYQHAFLDESLANYSTIVYFEVTYGEARAHLDYQENALFPYLFVMFSEGEFVLDKPTDTFPSNTEYGATIYGKGPVALSKIREAIGDDAFFGGLSAYFAAHRFGVAQPIDLLTAFEQASGQPLAELWSYWFDETNGTKDFTENDMTAIVEAIATAQAVPVASPVATPGS